MNLKRVIAGKYLHVPAHIEDTDRLWLRPGGIVDVSDPAIAKCVEGQEWKLEDVSEGAPDPITNPRLRRYVEELRGTAAPHTPRVEVEKAKAKTKAEPLVAAGIPAPDPRPKKEPAKGPF